MGTTLLPPAGTLHRIEAHLLANVLMGVKQDTIAGVIKLSYGEMDLDAYPGIQPYWIGENQTCFLIAHATIDSNGNVFNLANQDLQGCVLIFYNSVIGDITFNNVKAQAVYFLGGRCGKLSLTQGTEIYELNFRQEVNAGTLTIKGSSKITNLSVIDDASVEAVFIVEQSEIRLLLIHDATCGDIEIFSEARVQWITIDNTARAGAIKIWQKVKVAGLSIQGMSSVGNISIKDEAELRSLSLSDKSLASNIDCEEKANLGRLDINESMCGTIKYTDNGPPCKIYIREASQTGSLFFGNASLDTVLIRNNVFGFDSTATTIRELSIQDCTLLFFDLRVGTSGNIFISDSSVIECNLSDSFLAKDTVLAFTNTRIQFFLMDNFFVQGQLLLRDVGPIEGAFEWTDPEHLLLENPITKREKDFSTSQESELETMQLVFEQNQFYVLSEVYPAFEAAYEHCLEFLYSLYEQTPHPAIGEYSVMIGSEDMEINVIGDYDHDVDWLQEALVEKYYGGDSVFRIVNSSLGATEITDCDLQGFRFEFFNSRLLNCFISGTQLSKNNIDIHIYRPNRSIALNEETVFEQKTAFYNQLKKIFDNQGNIVETSWYHARSMENQQHLLKILLKEQPGPWLKKFRSDRFWDLITFWLNKQSNYHGESWARALKFLFITSFASYTFYFISIHYNEQFSFRGAGIFIGDYFGFLDITHRSDFHVPKEQLNVLAKFFDYFGKVIASYGIFQLVAAFRRHGKRSA